MTPLAEATAEKNTQAPFSSWKNGEMPEGYFRGGVDAPAQRFFAENGFVVLDRVLTGGEVEKINAEAVRLCRNESGVIEGIGSAPREMSDEDVLREVLCIHFPHKLSALMHDVLSHPALVQALTSLIGPDVKCMQSMLFLKGAGKPGQAWHQDEDFIPTRDRSLIGAWIALDDATLENGCLWIIPGSQRPGVLWKLDWHGDRRFDCTLESQGFPYTEADEVPVEVKKGSIVFFNGYTLHRSLPNRAAKGFRRSLVNHYMSASSLLPWRRSEEVPPSLLDYRDIVMIAGQDPYAWKGTEELAQAHVRASGDGGCMNWRTKEPRPYTR